MCEIVVGARPLKIFDTVFNPESPYRKKMIAKEASWPQALGEAI